MRSRWLLLLLSTLSGAPLAAQGVVYTAKSTYNIARIGNGDLTQTVSILGTDRQKTVTEGRMKFLLFGQDASGTEILRLDRDKAYSRSGKETKFREQDLAEVRARMEESQQRAAAEAPEAKTEDEDVRLYVVSEGMKPTGQRRTINGFDAQEQVFRATVMAENKKTGEKAPVFYLTADVWVDPSHAGAARVTQGFAKEYAAHLGMEPGLAGNPYARWLQEMRGSVRAVEGFPILTQFTVESDAAKDSDAAESPDASAEAAERVGKAMGGLMRRLRKKPATEAEKPAAGAEAPKAAPGRALLFQMTQEVTSISDAAPPASEFEVPGE